jgi:imidazolonepropionase-like amidohydrolase
VVGAIEVGKEADLLVVRGDPSADIRCVRDVVQVVRAGQLVAATPER